MVGGVVAGDGDGTLGHLAVLTYRLPTTKRPWWLGQWGRSEPRGSFKDENIRCPRTYNG